MGAPIRAGEASPLRVATGGDASWRLEARRHRSPARTNERRFGCLRLLTPQNHWASNAARDIICESRHCASVATLPML